MSSATANFNVNVKLRNDSPERVLKELAISPLIYIRLVGIVSCATCRVKRRVYGHSTTIAQSSICFSSYMVCRKVVICT